MLAVSITRPILNALKRDSFSIQLVAAANETPGYFPQLEQQLKEIPYPACYSNWISGLIAARLAQTAESQLKLAYFLMCSPEAVHMVQAIAPRDKVLATMAVKLYPKNITALYWLVKLLEINNPTEINNPKDTVSLYEWIVQINPNDGIAWREIGFFEELSGQLLAAESAYLNCCSNGDAGFNGCLGAGRVAEKLGNPRQAIEYYRLSKFPASLQRADQLEQQLQQP
ncbi:MAG: hypothetical protein P4L50_12680 [Anaerolineaceae bacterium]|nr:hypothetical protein [Anaerolineaceae bacterium]